MRSITEMLAIDNQTGVSSTKTSLNSKVFFHYFSHAV
jgi:hypothetical protein